MAVENLREKNRQAVMDLQIVDQSVMRALLITAERHARAGMVFTPYAQEMSSQPVMGSKPSDGYQITGA